MSADESKLLREEEVDDIDDVEFGHTAYVDTLEEVIHDAGGGWHIGLFGTWGTGKSSIVNLLNERIRIGEPTASEKNAPRYDFSDTIGFSINAWQHSGESIRTSLLLDLDRELDRQIGEGSATEGDEYGLLGSEEIMRKLYDVKTKEEQTERKGAIASLKEITPQIALALLTIIAGVLIARFSPISAVELGTLALGGGAIVGMLQYVYSNYRKERVSKQKTMENPRKEWTGAYKDIYEDILDEAQKRFREDPTTAGELQNIVITIDDLDRCQSASVYETLIALKSFMDQDLCTYIIPCDEEALYRHVKAADTGEYLDRKENQQHFLAKFFETRLRIPELPTEALQSYAADQNATLAGKLDQAVIDDVVMAANPSTPRRIIQAINRINTYRILADSRAEFEAIDTGSVADMKFLAKIVILQENYPEFFSALERNKIALQSLYAAREAASSEGRTAISSLLDEVGVPDDQQDDLIDFLIATRDVDQDPEPYLRLSGSELSESERFENALQQERVGDLSEMVTNADADTEAAYVDVIAKNLGDGDSRYSVFTTTLEILGAFEEGDHQKAITLKLYDVLADEDHAALLEGVHLNQLGPCITRLDAESQTDLLGWYIDAAVSEESVHDENLRALLEVSPDELDELYDVREQFAQNLSAALAAGRITKVEYDDVVDQICESCPQLYTERLVRGGIV